MIKLDHKETMTVAELREKLNEYPQDMPVFAEWEGVWASFKAANFSIDEHKPTDSSCLVIDVEDYYS